MNNREKIISAVEKAKKQSNENAQEYILVPLKEADMIVALLKEQPEVVRCKDCRRNHQCAIQFKFADADDEENWFCADGKKMRKND